MSPDTDLGSAVTRNRAEEEEAEFVRLTARCFEDVEEDVTRAATGATACQCVRMRMWI